MTSIEFTVMGTPKPKGRGRAFVNKATGRADVRTPQKTTDAEDSLAYRALGHAPTTPHAGPILLDACFVMPIPVSWPKWKQEAASAGHVLHEAKPDLDNLMKLLMDGLSGLFWTNDSKICKGERSKVYGDTPRTWVRVTPLEQVTRERWNEIKAAIADG